LRDRHAERRPALAAVRGPEDARLARRAGAGEHDGRIVRIDRHAPDDRAFHRVVEQAPLHSAVVTAIEPHVGARVDDLRVARVLTECPDDAVRMHPRAHGGPVPALALIGAQHDALTDGPNQDVSLVRHCSPPRVAARTPAALALYISLCWTRSRPPGARRRS